MPRLEFDMQEQEHNRWCWAAVSVSIDHFFDHNSEWRQCGIAHLELGAECCQKPVPRKCNEVHKLAPALERVGRLRGQPVGTLTMEEVRREIDVGKSPIAIRVVWKDGGGHFPVICGYEQTPRGDMVIVRDPFFGESIIPHDKLLTDYQVGHGAWTTSFLLKKA